MMKTRIATVVASMLVASLSAGAQVPAVPPSAATAAQSMQSMPHPAPQQQVPAQQQEPPTTAAGGETPGAQGQQVDQQIKKALTSSGVTATHVKVSFEGGTATLTGTVFTRRDIAKAKTAAMRVPGVEQVDVTNLHSRASKHNG